MYISSFSSPSLRGGLCRCQAGMNCEGKEEDSFQESHSTYAQS